MAGNRQGDGLMQDEERQTIGVCRWGVELLLRMEPPEELALAIRDVLEERVAQQKKWGEQNHDPFVWLAIIQEELGEASQEALKARFESDKDKAAMHLDMLRAEAIQLAAVSLAFVESLDRNSWDWGSAGFDYDNRGNRKEVDRG